LRSQGNAAAQETRQEGKKLRSREVKPAREKIVGPFYQCSQPWADIATKAAGQYLILALRLYRRWRGRPSGCDAIVVSAEALAGPGYSRLGKTRVVQRLEKAGLIEVVERKRKQAPRIRVIDPQLQS
jgi:hypothetical protein